MFDGMLDFALLLIGAPVVVFHYHPVESSIVAGLAVGLVVVLSLVKETIE